MEISKKDKLAIVGLTISQTALCFAFVGLPIHAIIALVVSIGFDIAAWRVSKKTNK